MKVEIEGLEFQEEGFDRAEPYFSMHDPEIGDVESREELTVVGNGGSVTSFRALAYAFPGKDFSVVTTMEPGFLRRVNASRNGTVLGVSKSGSTPGVIEAFLSLNGEKKVLTEIDSPLWQIADQKGMKKFEHPRIGGRFTGLSETALIPAEMLGIDSQQIFRGGRQMHNRCRPGDPNIASKTAQALHHAEKKGFTEVAAAFYSTRLFGFKPLLVQLMHESVCKKGEGQTFYGDLGPEIQHHTNQRIFGGRENVLPLIIEAPQEKMELQIPEGTENIKIRGRELGDMEGLELGQSLEAEAQGVKDELREQGRPFINVKLEEMSFEEVGRFMAFLQYLAVYSAWIRGVDPFNQPNVENAKNRAFEKRFEP